MRLSLPSLSSITAGVGVQKSAQRKTPYLQEVSMLHKSTMSINRASGDLERWSENWRKLFDTKEEVAHVHQVQSAAQTVIGELQICSSPFLHLAVLHVLQ